MSADDTTGAGTDRPPDTVALTGLRSFTRWSLATVAVVDVAVPALDLATRGLAPAATVAAAVGLAYVGVEQARMLMAGMAGFAHGLPSTARVTAATTVALALLAALGSSGDGASWIWALPFGSIVCGVALGSGRQARTWVLVGGALSAGVVAGGAALLGVGADGSAGGAFLLATAAVVVIATSTVAQIWFWDVTLRLEAARGAAAEVAVLRERLRFASDLHDVQGHHLQAIALKAQLARRLVGHDDEGARRHATEAEQLALLALDETRALVHGYRRVGLSTELDNAVAILRAAGVDATILDVPHPVPATAEPLFGALVREGATNLLRHTQAERCEISVRREGETVVVRMRDDGRRHATGATALGGSGLDSLRERFAAAGGRVDAGPVEPQGFVLSGRLPR